MPDCQLLNLKQQPKMRDRKPSKPGNVFSNVLTFANLQEFTFVSQDYPELYTSGNFVRIVWKDVTGKLHRTTLHHTQVLKFDTKEISTELPNALREV